jgi:YqjK-like protein
MKAKLIELAGRRATLAAKSAAQREELAQTLAHWRTPIIVVDQGWAALRYLGKNPVLLGGAVAVVVALRPWRMVKWLPPGWLLWRIARMALAPKGILRGC